MSGAAAAMRPIQSIVILILVALLGPLVVVTPCRSAAG
jgi:hypothetical protein